MRAWSGVYCVLGGATSREDAEYLAIEAAMHERPDLQVFWVGVYRLRPRGWELTVHGR